MTAFIRLACAVVLALMAALAAPAMAQVWPQRTVKFILPLGPGSGADIGARLLADLLQKTWGQSVVVENRPGGDAIVAIQAFIGANDDHTLLFSPTSAFIGHPYSHSKMPYDASALIPLARVSTTLVSIVVPAAMKVATMAEFAARARAEPGKLNWVSTTGLNDVLFESYLKANDLNLARVPYRDFVQGLNDVAENRVHVYFAAYAIARPQVEAGKVTVLALANTTRTDMLPGVPTVREAGFPQLEIDGLVGLFAPPVLPVGLHGKIAADVNAATRDPLVSSRLTATGQVVNPGTPAEFAAAIEQQRGFAERAAAILGLKRAN